MHLKKYLCVRVHEIHDDQNSRKQLNILCFTQVEYNGLTSNITLEGKTSNDGKQKGGRRVDVGLDLIEYDTDGAIQLVCRLCILRRKSITPYTQKLDIFFSPLQ